MAFAVTIFRFFSLTPETRHTLLNYNVNKGRVQVTRNTGHFVSEVAGYEHRVRAFIGNLEKNDSFGGWVIKKFVKNPTFDFPQVQHIFHIVDTCDFISAKNLVIVCSSSMESGSSSFQVSVKISALLGPVARKGLVCCCVHSSANTLPELK